MGKPSMFCKGLWPWGSWGPTTPPKWDQPREGVGWERYGGGPPPQEIDQQKASQPSLSLSLASPGEQMAALRHQRCGRASRPAWGQAGRVSGKSWQPWHLAIGTPEPGILRAPGSDLSPSAQGGCVGLRFTVSRRVPLTWLSRFPWKC